MPDYRYPRKCYNQLLKINADEYGNITVEKQIMHNCVRNLENILKKTKFQLIFEKQSHILLKAEMKNIILAANEILYNEDTHRILNSSYNKHFKTYNTSQNYLSFNIPHNILKLTAQLRTSNPNNFSLFQDGFSHKFNSEEIRDICNLLEENNLNHFLFRWPIYNPFRNKYITKHVNLTNTEDAVKTLLGKPTKKEIFDVHRYFQAADRKSVV